ncbi:PREDICTED: uncharacterized protein LOC105569014 [Vollenhovia emeryi]|uniref:uncharacterized protein LOC105569014 n=1 Tax=Vollenhovia emeryi TaxID=411798 RepID=UPI0005F5479E|nr:PREDICTED: uncharacterized protein LOC105569014 [Vollenhovia emeryi]
MKFCARSEQNADLRGGCWSRSRYSVFFTINATGLLEVYDILNGLDSPVTTFRVCNDSLTAIAPHENGQLLAVGGHDGNIYLVECSEGLIINTKADKANLTAYFERCIRFEKTTDTRLKEIRLMPANIHEDSAADHDAFVPKSRHQKRNNKGGNKSKTQVREKGEHPRKKYRTKKMEKDHTFFEELTESEEAFFQAVNRELASYTRLDPEKVVSLVEVTRKKKLLSREASTAGVKKPRKSMRMERIRASELESPTRSSTEGTEVDKEEAGERAVTTLGAPFVKPRKTVKKRRGEEISRKVCAIEVCKPEICCADLEEKWKAEVRAQLASEGKKYSWVITQRRRELFDLEQKLPEHSSVGEKRILLVEDESLANILADEVGEARREMRAWQERIALGKRDFWRPRTIEVVQEKPEGKKKEVGNGDVESPARGSDFRQLVETSSKWRSAIEDKTLQTRGKRKARKLDSYLEKCDQEEGTLSAHTDESTEMITMMSARRE